MSVQIFNSIEQASALPADRPLHLAAGMFDGVHLGHRAVIEAAVQSARRSGGLCAVLTFSPHPSRIFRPADPVRLIMSDAQKVRMLSALGLDAVITHPFDATFATVEAEELLPRLKAALPALAAIYVGENWRFGRGRRGDIQMLVREARRQDIHVVSAQRINHDGEPISSTRIRACLEAGEMEEANALLGYSYHAEGMVASGKKLGGRIGFPTLNLAWNPDLPPRHGVYVVRVRADRADGPWLRGVANYGLRPTVEQSEDPKLEVHLLEPCPLGEGDVIVVEWLRFLRPEQHFDGVESLRHQIAVDREAAERFFAGRRAV